MKEPQNQLQQDKENFKQIKSDKCAKCKRRNVSVLRGFCNVCEALWMAKGTEIPFYANKLTEVEIAQMNPEEKQRYRYIDSGAALKKFFSYKNLTIDDLIENK